MGNCLTQSSDDDSTLLNESEHHVTDSSLHHHAASQFTSELPPAYANENPIQVQDTQLREEPVPELSEEQQSRRAQRIGLIQHLPTDKYQEHENAKAAVESTESKHIRECVICMIDFQRDDLVRYLPCMHRFHKECIDDWLLRSFMCPSCMEPVDTALLTSYNTDFQKPSSLPVTVVNFTKPKQIDTSTAEQPCPAASLPTTLQYN